MAFSLALLGASTYEKPVLGSYDLLSTTILTSNTASVTFASLGTYAADYQHLQLRIVARGSNSANFTIWNMRLNGDSGSNYATHALFGNGSLALGNDTRTSTDRILDSLTLPGNSTANSYGALILDILDSFNTSKNKTIRYLGGRRPSDDTVVILRSGLYISTSSITSIALTCQSADWNTGSRFSLYGLRKV
jgi:hypothetical protein